MPIVYSFVSAPDSVRLAIGYCKSRVPCGSRAFSSSKSALTLSARRDEFYRACDLEDAFRKFNPVSHGNDWSGLTSRCYKIQFAITALKMGNYKVSNHHLPIARALSFPVKTNSSSGMAGPAFCPLALKWVGKFHTDNEGSTPILEQFHWCDLFLYHIATGHATGVGHGTGSSA